MDPEKFDRVLLDVLYEEADEVTRAAAERHMTQSERARRTFEDLRAARKVGQLPLVEPPAGLRERILEAERSARAERSLASRFGGLVSLVASYTMRPQMGMAALLLLMLGSSLLLLRARPGAHDRIQVTERGVPEAEGESVTILPVAPPRDGLEKGGEAKQSRAAPAARAGTPAAPPPPEATQPAEKGRLDEFLFPTVRQRAADRGSPGSIEPTDAFDDAMRAYKEGRYAEAERRFDDVAKAGDPNAPTAELYAARAAKRTSGCGNALGRLETLALRHAGTELGHEAAWLSAECHRQLGSSDRAATAYRDLLDVPAYEEKAKRALAAMAEPAAETSAAGQAAPAKPASRPAATQAAP
jgi:TolA-binding protein